jgi:hypothetical protein
MNIILAIKANNKDSNSFCKAIDVTQVECNNLCRIAREINETAGQTCINVYIHKI